MLHAISVGLVVPLEYGEVEAVCTIDLNVKVSGTGDNQSSSQLQSKSKVLPEDIAPKVDHSCGSFATQEERPLRYCSIQSLARQAWVTDLSIQDDTPPFVNPKILFDETAVLGRQQAVGEADKTVGGIHVSVGGGESYSRTRRRHLVFYTWQGPSQTTVGGTGQIRRLERGTVVSTLDMTALLLEREPVVE